MKKFKILASPSSIGQIDNIPFEILESNNFEVIKNPYGRKLTNDETISLAEDCVGIVAGVETFDKNVIDSLPKLKCISRVGVGMDSIDLKYAKSKGVEVINTPDGPTRAVAELTLGLTLSLMRKIPKASSDMKNKVWKKQTGNLLHNKIVGIIGLGRIGKLTSRLFKSLGNNVIAFDKYPDYEWAKENHIKITDLDSLIKTADIVCLHVPRNNDGTPLIGARELSLMKKTTSVVNVSRGGVVDENKLYDFLSEGKIRSAAIDVFVEEPYYGKLSELDNVILTPHIGSYAKEGKLKMEVDAVKNLINVLKKNNVC